MRAKRPRNSTFRIYFTHVLKALIKRYNAAPEGSYKNCLYKAMLNTAEMI